MREIKFRGKRLDNGEWLYGNLIELRNPFNHEDSPACFIMPKEVNIADPDSIAEQEVVDPATVGQFTDLLDKNGKEIYFGDIVRDKYGDIGSVIWFSDCSMRVDWGGGDIHFIDPEWGLEVIGNIHDDPELLKQ